MRIQTTETSVILFSRKHAAKTGASARTLCCVYTCEGRAVSKDAVVVVSPLYLSPLDRRARAQLRLNPGVNEELFEMLQVWLGKDVGERLPPG